jgi:branched-chain amino acid transport system permease protein
VYAVIAIGYTLVYGILFMINFAHGEVMMLGAFAGYFVFEALNATVVNAETGLTFLNAYPIPAIILAFLAGMTVSTILGIYLEKIAYRPLRGAPRLVPLISAIGASIFLQNVAQLMFSPQRRTYTNPDILARNSGWTILISGRPVIITYTGAFTFVLSILLLIGLWILVQRTRFGRAMRAVAENKQTAALMGIDVDSVISRTFAVSGALAGAAGVMWGLHNGIIYFYIGFIPGIKAFTAAVLGGIGNIPGAMVGGLFLGIVESLGPAALGIDFQLKDVIAFSILVLVLIFRPSGILGEVLSEEKV